MLGETTEEGESDEMALKRWLREEADIEITIGRYLGPQIEFGAVVI